MSSIEEKLPENTSASTLGERIRSRRQLFGWTQTELAKRSGVGQNQISNYEADGAKPSSDAIVALAQALEVSADWLLGTSSGMPNDLNDAELRLIEIFRQKPPERYEDILEIMRRV